MKNTKRIVFHYHRADNQFADWKIWVWHPGQEGNYIEFNEFVAYEAIATYDVPSDVIDEEIGFIVCTNQWQKEVGNERFIQLNDQEEIHLWVREYDERIYYNAQFISATLQLQYAKVLNLSTILIQFNEPVVQSIVEELVAMPHYTIVSISPTDWNQQFIIIVQERLNLAELITITAHEAGETTADIIPYVQNPAFDELFAYDGTLGVVYEAQQTSWYLWAPTAQGVELVIYPSTDQSSRSDMIHQTLPVVATYRMECGNRGVWSYTQVGDMHLTTYRFRVSFANGTVEEVVDPYMIAATVNGHYSVVIDLDQTNPPNWEHDQLESFAQTAVPIIYEAHIRDFTIGEESGVKAKGMFTGLVERNTLTSSGHKTGLDYLVDLGITHLQLLPMAQNGSVDEVTHSPYNWGYDPTNYNVPEGNYTSDVFDPVVRIKEMKQMIQGLHQANIRVIMDVVYNHVYRVEEHAFQKIVPGYYFRYHADGSLANGTGVGNDTASERKMMRKFIVDSVSFWAKEYHLDGFRFDLMGNHDIETMNILKCQLDQIRPGNIVLGEGWDLNTPLPYEQKAIQANAYKMPNIAHFNDTLRDSVKGMAFDASVGGFVSGMGWLERSIVHNMMGGTPYYHGEGRYSAPNQLVQYVDVHDGLTLFDKLTAVHPDEDTVTKVKRQVLATSMVLLSQGILFLQAGQEMMRTKQGHENSYNLPDPINHIDWGRIELFEKEIETIKALIRFRKEYPDYTIHSYEELYAVYQLFMAEHSIIMYRLRDYIVIFNGSTDAKEIPLPHGIFAMILQDGETKDDVVEQALTVPWLSTTILKRMDHEAT